MDNEYLDKMFGESIKKLSRRPDLMNYLRKDGERQGTNYIGSLVALMMLLEMAYDPAFPNNIRTTGLTDEQMAHTKRSLRAATNLRLVFPERPDLVTLVEYLKEIGGVEGLMFE